MRANVFAELANLLDILIPKVSFCKTTIGFDQAPGKIGRPVAHETFHIIQNRTHLLSRESGVIEKRNEGMNSLLKIDVVLPECIVCINQEMISHILSFPMELSFIKYCALLVP